MTTRTIFKQTKRKKEDNDDDDDDEGEGKRRTKEKKDREDAHTYGCPLCVKLTLRSSRSSSPLCTVSSFLHLLFQSAYAT